MSGQIILKKTQHGQFCQKRILNAMRPASTTRGRNVGGAVVCNEWDEWCSSDDGADLENVSWSEQLLSIPKNESLGLGPNNKSAVLLFGCPECDLLKGESWPWRSCFSNRVSTLTSMCFYLQLHTHLSTSSHTRGCEYWQTRDQGGFSAAANLLNLELPISKTQLLCNWDPQWQLPWDVFL